MKTLKICLVILCLLPFRAVGLPQFDGANFFMKEIQLTRGMVTLVDDEDFEALNQWKWQAQPSRRTFYATRSKVIDGKKRQIRMHRVILGLTDRSLEGDHKDRNGLNNQRSNLRVATLAQNQYNKSSHQGARSKFKGVFWYQRNKKWGAKIRQYGKERFLGLHITQEDAAKAYDKAALISFGEFANLNFPV